MIINGRDQILVNNKNDRFGKPESPVSLHTYKSHSLNYDRLKKIPLWVIENLSKDDNKKDQVADRVHSSFQV